MQGKDMHKVSFVGAGPGDPDLITVKGMDLLKNADLLIYTGSLINPELVTRSLAKVKRNSHGMNLEEITSLIISHYKMGDRVVRLHTGDPSLYSAIHEQIIVLLEAGIEVEIIPGVSSMFGAAAALGIQFTGAGIAETLIVTRPRGKTLSDDDIEQLSEFCSTLVFFLGSDRIDDITMRLKCPKDTPAAVVYHATWPDQVIIRGSVQDIAKKTKDSGITRSALLIVGQILSPGSSGEKRSVLYS